MYRSIFGVKKVFVNMSKIKRIPSALATDFLCILGIAKKRKIWLSAVNSMTVKTTKETPVIPTKQGAWRDLSVEILRLHDENM